MNGALAIGVFGWEEMIGLEVGEQIVKDVVGVLEGFFEV